MSVRKEEKEPPIYVLSLLARATGNSMKAPRHIPTVADRIVPLKKGKP